jgi:formiminoglutamate deiminase
VTRLWCEFAWLGGERAEPGVVIELDGKSISSVGRSETAPADSERLAGVTIPGLANAHSHAFHRALRARTQDGRGTFWTWREQMYEVAGRLDPESYLRLARATYGEMALAGITLVGEFHYLHHGPGGTPYDDPNAMGQAIAQAAAEAGIRLTLLDTCYLHGGIGEEPGPVQQRFSDGSADAWRERVEALSDAALQPGDAAGIRLGAGIHSLRAVDPLAARRVAEWANDRAVPLHAHVSEQPAENEACVAAYGVTPTALLRAAGALSESFTAVHGTHMTGEDVVHLGSANATCCLCPTTERDLADGIGPGRRMRDAGAQLAVGSDSHAAIDLFEEARAIELDERLASGERGRHRAADLLRAATADGYRSLGWPAAGTIATGAPADLVTVALDTVRMAGTPADALVDGVVFAATAADVRDVMVAGRWIVREGRHLTLDVAGELRAVLAE